VKGSEPVYDWHVDPYWRNRRLSPAQIQVHDVRLEGWRQDMGAMLEMQEILSSSLLPALEQRDRLANTLPIEEATKNRNEQNQLKTLATEFGWLNVLRSDKVQSTISDPADLRKLRWIHISVSVKYAYERHADFFTCAFAEQIFGLSLRMFTRFEQLERRSWSDCSCTASAKSLYQPTRALLEAWKILCALLSGSRRSISRRRR
jgi:hypothetical protein